MFQLDIRRLDPRGPAYIGELITSGTCVVDHGAIAYAHADLAPFTPPATPQRVCLYINGKYAGFATLGPNGFLQNVGDASPWLAFA